MPTAIDLTNVRFGKLTAKEPVTVSGRRKWRCLCDCGRETVVDTGNLRTGNSTACGKCRTPTLGNRKHGHTDKDGYRSPTYRSWSAMRRRCADTGRDNATHYALAGIACCDEWADFESFVVDMGERPEGTTLDRIDTTKGYSKANCRWATPLVQTRNRKTAVLCEWEGSLRPVAEIAAAMGVNYYTAWSRLKRGGARMVRAYDNPLR
jgi:hypothetical protein